jgi:hypothetical protein
VRPRDLLACAVLLAAAEACGGKTTSVAQTSGVPDATPDADTADTSEVGSGGSPDASIPDSRDTGKAGTGGAPVDAADVRPDVAWSHKCWCKNWQDDVYPKDFYDETVGNCVSGLTCQEPKSVCCATTCVNPAVCQNTSNGHFDCHSQPPNDCCNFIFSVCVRPEDCAPEGVLKHQPYDAGNVSNVQACMFPDDAGK